MRHDTDTIASLLMQNPSAGLRICAQPNLLARLIATQICKAWPARTSWEALSRLAPDDYRKLAIYLHKAGKPLEQCFPKPDSLPIENGWVEAESLDALDRTATTTVYFVNPGHHTEVAAFLGTVNGHPARFVECQLDVPGRNAAFRDGVVKAWMLPFGTSVVSKRDNPRKPGRLLAEINAISSVLTRFGQTLEGCVSLGAEPSSGTFTMNLPIAVIRDAPTSYTYALWSTKQGETLEELLLTNDLCGARRNSLLKQYRRCLDVLFDHGVVWRDMSPRNIIVEAGLDGGDVFHLVDFEKTELHESPLSLDERTSACRMQFCVEELGVICERSELLQTFDGLFDPQSWDFESTAALGTPPRAELADLLNARHVGTPISVGSLNMLDKEVYEIRRPRRKPNGDLIRPGLLGFRTEHYLSLMPEIDATDYDRKVTEILLTAERAGRLFAVFDALWVQLAQLETMVLAREFEAILRDGNSQRLDYPREQADAVCVLIDTLMRCAIPSEFDVVLHPTAREIVHG
ncbi:MAG: hypothetical protein GDA50_06390 [Alphaproteobacteria bacterium GM202ARS2]|nr:hypothetical protein [Alphaproteobacteria bacterium GM202ARS2]